jgi:hypothetical protein
MKDEKEDVSSYGMTLRKGESRINWKITFSGEFALEESMNLL